MESKGSLSVQQPQTDTGRVLFSYFTCFHTTTFIFLSLFALVETISLKIWERPRSWPEKCSRSGCRPWPKNVACLSSLISLCLKNSTAETVIVYFLVFHAFG